MRLRFTIRDLLWLAVVVALTVGWWLESRKLRSRLEVYESILHARDVEREMSSGN